MSHIWQTHDVPGAYVDLPSYLLEHRILFLGPELTTEIASDVAMKMLALSDGDDQISLYVNCYGGSVPAGLAVVDVMESIIDQGTPVATYCLGEAVGVATVILAAGSTGLRRAFPSARISLYQEWYGAESLWGAATQDESERKRLMELVEAAVVRHCDAACLPRKGLQGSFQDLAFMNASQAMKVGLIDALCGAPATPAVGSAEGE